MSTMLLEKVKDTFFTKDYPPLTECAVPESAEVAEFSPPVFVPEAKVQSWPSLVIKATAIKPESKFEAEFEAEFWDKPFTDWSAVIDRARYQAPFETSPKEAHLIRQFYAAIRSVVEEAGLTYANQPQVIDGVPLMRYLNADGTGDCLVGRALLKMGVSAADLAGYEGRPAGEVVAHQYGSGFREFRDVAQSMQIVNDSRMPWGMALNYCR